MTLATPLPQNAFDAAGNLVNSVTGIATNGAGYGVNAATTIGGAFLSPITGFLSGFLGWSISSVRWHFGFIDENKALLSVMQPQWFFVFVYSAFRTQLHVTPIVVIKTLVAYRCAGCFSIIFSHFHIPMQLFDPEILSTSLNTWVFLKNNKWHNEIRKFFAHSTRENENLR